MDLADDDAMGNYGHEEEVERRRMIARLRGEDVSDDSGGEAEEEDRQAVIEPVVRTLVAALGGWEDVDDEVTGESSRIYRPGDSIVGCLKDLKKLWRKDDTDDERTVARIFARSGVIRDLVAILEEVSERGSWGVKVGLMAADLLAAMTWPIDVAAELKELEDEPATTTDYSSLLHAQLEYKGTILRSGVVLDRLMGLVLPTLAKPSVERQEKDERVISLILHIIRNLLSIKDAVGSTFTSGDAFEKSTLQSTLIVQLQSSHFLPLLLTLASSSQTKDFNPFNVLVLDTLQLIFRGIRASDLAKDQKTAVRDSLTSLLETENLKHQTHLRNSSSRHSRFGTTVSVHTGGDASRKVVLHRSGAITGDAGVQMDLGKKRGVRGKVKKNDELSQPTQLTSDAMKVLQAFAHEFLEVAFNTFFASILKDIRMERPKVRETDNVRALYLSTFFIEFFLLSRGRASAAAASDVKGKGREDDNVSKIWDFGYVAEFAEIDAVKWVVGRMRLVMEDKPVGWTELQAAINCFTQILLLIDSMAASKEEEPLEAAEILQNQIYYNGDILDLAHDLVAKYKDQSVAYLDAVVHLAYVLLRMLEKYSKSNSYMFVRKRKAKKARRNNIRNGRAEDDGENEDVDMDRGAVSYGEHAFAFEKYETRYASEDVLATLLSSLERFADFDSPEKMKRVVGLLHRLAVKVKAEGLFFKVSVLDLFRRILDNQLSLPKDASSKDLLALIHFVLRKFFKSAEESPFLVVEAFFPKNRNQWKLFSSWAPEQGEEGDSGKEGTSKVKKIKIPGDVQIKDQGLTLTQELGIAVAVLLETGKMGLVTWVVELLNDVAAARQEVILHTDGVQEIPLDQTDDEIRAHANKKVEASEAARAKFIDHNIDYTTEDRRTASTLDPHLKLMFRLLDFSLAASSSSSHDHDPSFLQWTIPASHLPSSLESFARIIEGFIREPLDLNGDKPTDRLKRKLAPRKRRVLDRPEVSDDDDDGAAPPDGQLAAKRRRLSAPRKKRVRRAPLDGSDPGALPVSSDDDGAGQRQPRRRLTKKKEEDTSRFKSAQFILDSDEDEEADAKFWAAEKARIERQKQQSAEGAAAAAVVVAGSGNNMRKGGSKVAKRKKGWTVDRDRDRLDASQVLSSLQGSSVRGSSVGMSDADREESAVLSQSRRGSSMAVEEEEEEEEAQREPSMAVEEEDEEEAEEEARPARPRPKPRVNRPVSEDEEEEEEGDRSATMKRKKVVVVVDSDEESE